MNTYNMSNEEFINFFIVSNNYVNDPIVTELIKRLEESDDKLSSLKEKYNDEY